ncbi:hypothetical protein [Streptomyces sp. JJ36]|uniref:hypothetical protein n=1 Tax=Streptomyces sp. JJ36 TaxID=2736645 RepID=UPI001F1F2752|nr:hypothetical protein [Streptomyces sp. JJ36]MCF6523129.1 hypothetical protein [Streptomyces sp. JJ36]
MDLEFVNGRLEVKAVPDGAPAPIDHFAGPPFGKAVEVPDPVGITLETEKLKDYSR